MTIVIGIEEKLLSRCEKKSKFAQRMQRIAAYRGMSIKFWLDGLERGDGKPKDNLDFDALTGDQHIQHPLLDGL